MKRSSYLWSGEEDWPVAVGHDGEGKPVPKDMSVEPNAAYSLHCTPTDMAKFVNFLLQQPQGDPLRLRSDLYTEMFTPQIAVNNSISWQKDWPKSEIQLSEQVFWGLGWGLVKEPAGFSFWHWGDRDVTKVFVAAYPEKKRGVVMMGNSREAAKIWKDILDLAMGEEHPGLEWVRDNLGL
jgi:CubicO group peptidase (beta-lactamase class C family)